MPDATTAHLALPLLQAAQAQKHVTHNEALMGLDTLVQLAVLDKDLTAPPASPAEGDRYLIAAAAPTGAWAGWAGRVVRYQDGAWRSFVPRPGWLAVVADEADLYTYTGAAWASYRSTLTALQNLARLGIGTTADAANPFAAKLNKALWTALTTGEGGTGDLRYTLNKQDAGNTLSLLLQSGFSGRAEIGLTGDDDLRLKVSADGGTWREALRVEAATGAVSVAQAVTCGNPGLQTGAGLVVRESAHASGSRRATIALGSGWQINQDSLATGGRDFSLYSTALGRSALAVATSGQVTVSNGLNVGGGLTLNNGTGNTLQFASAGVAAPSTGSRSAGTKLVLYPNVSATEADFAVGIEIGAMWHSIPHSGTFYRWYAGSTQRMQLDGNGNLSAAGKITGTGFV
ncbi:DUF2793 domain-containing protein, partial [Methylobacterium sp. DB0501]|uniref:DUF2793 domain-containing protein n=1 Tax=Methylobacterium sp. DB0501 TaxID=2709665 RepID=UPI001FED4FCD